VLPQPQPRVERAGCRMLARGGKMLSAVKMAGVRSRGARSVMRVVKEKEEEGSEEVCTVCK